MQAIININLSKELINAGGVDDRYAIVISAVRKLYPKSLGEVRCTNADDRDDRLVQFTAIITFEFHTQKNIVLDSMNQIARAFNQEYVAVLFNDGVGRLVGPAADLSSGFKINHFKRPAFFDLLKEAA
jgi:hypothetical protein